MYMKCQKKKNQNEELPVPILEFQIVQEKAMQASLWGPLGGFALSC